MENNNTDLLKQTFKKVNGIYFFIISLTIVLFLQQIQDYKTIETINYLKYALLTIIVIGLTRVNIDFKKLKEKFFLITINKHLDEWTKEKQDGNI